jgi:hypothetical protein
MRNTETQIDTIKKMQVIELEAGFPNGDLYNDLQDMVNAIETKADQERRKGKVSLWENQLR